MTTYKLTYFGARARAELIRLIFVQAEVEFENERLPYYAGTAEWTAKKASKYTTTASISISQYIEFYKCMSVWPVFFAFLVFCWILKCMVT